MRYPTGDNTMEYFSAKRSLLALAMLALLALASMVPGQLPESETASNAAGEPADTPVGDAAPTAVATGEGGDAVPPGEPELFFDVVDVNVINVEAFVTDKKGNRILGLKKDDFELSVDGKPVAISNFYAVEEGKAQIEEGPQYLRQDDVEEEESIITKEPEVPDEQKLHLVIYIDNFNLKPFSRNRSFGYIRTFLRTRLRPGDEVMLMSYDRSLHTRHPFTSDPELIASGLYDLEEVSAHAVHSDSDRKDILEQIYEAEDLLTMRGRANQYAGALYNDVSFTITALKELVDNLAGLPGRKAILYVSDGLPMRPAEDIYHALNDRFAESSVLSEAFRFDATREYQELTAKANANRVTFYTLEAAGLRTYSFIDASNFQANGGALIDQVHFSNLQHSLQFMAEETGGMALLNTNNFGPLLDRVADDFSTYYSLGFSSASTSGRYYRINIKIKDHKEFKVRIRDGYRSKTIDSRVSETTLAALHYGIEQNALGIELEMGRETPGEKRYYMVPIQVKIPLDNLSLIPQNDMYRGRIRLFIGAKDNEGGVAPVQDLPIPIDISREEYEQAKGAFYKYSVTLQMRRGRQIVAVGVRDEIGSVTSYVTQGLTVGI